jgi:hypothetical protein
MGFKATADNMYGSLRSPKFLASLVTSPTPRPLYAIEAIEIRSVKNEAIFYPYN